MDPNRKMRKSAATEAPPQTEPPNAASGSGKTRLCRKDLSLGAICFLSYATVYAGKGLLGAILPQLTESNALLGDAAGSMGSVFLLTYGIGQLVNGILGDRIPAKYMVFSGLAAGGGILLCLPYLTVPFLAILLWGICGFCCSMLWGPISATIGENTGERIAPILLTSLTVASVLGGLIASFFAICSVAARNWRLAFFLAGGVMLTCAVLWLAFCIAMEQRGQLRTSAAGRPDVTALPDRNPLTNSLRQVLCPGFFAAVLLTCANGVLRNATALWISTWLHRYLGFSVGGAAGISAILPVLTIAATVASLWLLRLAKGREKPLCACLGLLQTGCFAGTLAGGTRLPWLSVTALFLAMACALGICNLIFSKYILRYRSCGRLSGISGFFDFASYFSAALSNLWFTALADRDAWERILCLWTAFSLLSFLAALGSVHAREVGDEEREKNNKGRT